MVGYEIVSKETGIKTVMMVKFIRDDGKESAVQRYEVDGSDDEYIKEQLELSAKEFNERKL